VTDRTRDALAPLRQRRFAWYFASRLVNSLGTTMATIALAFAVLDLTGSATALGQVLAAHTIPMVLFLLFGGVVADRLPRTLVIQVSNLTSGVTQGVVAALVISGTAELWHILCLEAVHGLASGLGFPALGAVVPDLVPRRDLQRANALLSLSRGMTTILGPSLGALLVVTVGPGWALAVDAATWLAAAALLAPVRLPAPVRDRPRTGMVAELREGWDLFRMTTWLWVVVLAFGALNAISTGALHTLGPAVAQDTIGRQAWGLALSAEAVGLLATTLVMLVVPLQRPLLYGMLGMSTLAAPLAALGLGAPAAVLVVLFVVAGVGSQVFGLGWSLAMQENIPRDMQARAWSYDSLGSFVAMPLGQLLYGPLGEAFGSREVLVVSGFLYAAVCLLTLTSASVRELPRATPVRSTSPPAS
jgi:MFS family permease